MEIWCQVVYVYVLGGEKNFQVLWLTEVGCGSQYAK